NPTTIPPALAGDPNVHLNEYSIADSQTNLNGAKWVTGAKLTPPAFYNLTDRFNMYASIEVKKPLSVRMPAGKIDYGPVIKCSASCPSGYSCDSTSGICVPTGAPVPAVPVITQNYPTHEVCYQVKGPKLSGADQAVLNDEFGYGDTYTLSKIT